MSKAPIQFALAAALATLSGCAAMFSPSSQEVLLRTGDTTEMVQINGGDSIQSGRSIELKKERQAVQVVVSSKQYRDEQFILMQYSMSPLHFFSWVPWFITAGPQFDWNSKSAYSYPGELDLKYVRIPQIRKEREDAKNVKVAAATANLTNKNLSSVDHVYSDWVDNPAEGEAKRSNTSDQYQFTDAVANGLNEFLAKNGFSGEGSILGSKSNTLFLHGNLESLRMHYVNNKISLDRIVYADLAVSWELRNSDDKVLFAKKRDVTSGQFIFGFPYIYGPMLTQVVGDGMEKSLALFLSDSAVRAEIYAPTKSAPPASVKKAIKLIPSRKYVANLQQAVKSSVTIKGKSGHGSGFVISGDGYIVTNYHVIDRIPDGKVILNDKSKFDYEVVQFDKDIDLALIKIDASGLVPFRLQKTGTPDVGGDVYAIGAPESAELSQSLTKGVVSGIRTTESGSKLIQTDASVNPGNSGGALVDPKGLVVGVVSSKLACFGVEGVAFGIPASEIVSKLKVEPSN